jgi:hypothetical protein
LQSLKAAVQTIGLDTLSVGWVILDKLVAGDVEGPEWDAIWNVVADGQVSNVRLFNSGLHVTHIFTKATLLLPTEPASTGLIVTPEFVRDHIAFYTGPVRESTPLVTLGGLRGVINE